MDDVADNKTVAPDEDTEVTVSDDTGVQSSAGETDESGNQKATTVETADVAESAGTQEGEVEGPTSEEIGEATEGAEEEAAASAVEEVEVEELSFLDALATVPETIRDYLISDDIEQKRREIYEKADLSQEEQDIALKSELNVFFGVTGIDEFPDDLWSELPWDDKEEQRAKDLAVEIVGRVMLPAQAYVGDVVGLLAELGADAADFPQEQLEIRRISYDQGIDEVIEAVGTEGLDEAAVRRLRHIIDARLRGVRDDMETQTMLSKPAKVGGLELPEERAGEIIGLIQEKMRLTNFAEQVEEEIAAGKKEWSVEEIKEIYAGSAEEREEISKHRSEIVQQLEVGGVDIRNIFYDIINPPDLLPPTSSEVVAGLLVLANEDQLTAALNDDERYREVVRKYYEGRGDEAGFAEFEKDVASPQSLNVFLQTVLRGYGSLDEQNSARLCLRVLNLLKKRGHAQYAELAAFDMDEGRFVWNQPIEM